jgi:AraC-like DNA-binding protein
MIKSFYFLLLLILGVSCSNPVKKEKITEQYVQKEIDKLQSVQDSSNTAMIVNTSKKIKEHAKAINYDVGVFQCNLIIMNSLCASGNYKETIAIGKENERLVKNIKSNYGLCTHYRILGAAYLNLGLVDEGKNFLNKALEYNEKIKDKNVKYFQLALIYDYFAFGEAMGNGSPASERTKKYYLKKLWAIQQIDNSKEFELKKNQILSFLYMNLGVISNQEKKTKEAEAYFHKALQICKKYGITKQAPTITNNEMAWLLFDQKKYDSCISYAQTGIAFEKNDSKPQIRRDLFEVLYKSYSEKGDVHNSEKYTKLYMKLNDSILDAQEMAINEPVKSIVKEKEEDHKKNIFSILTIIGISILLLATVIFLLWRRNQKILHKKYENIISQLKNEDHKSPVFEDEINQKLLKADKSITINEATVSSILQKLEKFEKSERFLKKDINLSYLANFLDTNPRYLSEIINQYKGKNVNHYLNGLRIHRITELLYKEPVYREYKITYLAEYCGFASREVFAAAFKKETGVTPSYFINQLVSDQKEYV